jgi:DNA invertase Pin-like site-specific DNA recombinase
MSAQITPQHREKLAYVYLRQSSPGQLRHHQQSTERQYALKEKALALGWNKDLIRTLDGDLGHSAAPQSAPREDFKTLVAEVSMGQVGAVFALEVSRLARSNLDWARLLELCALTRTLVVDEDGCYDPADFNDGLLLGLKGTMATAELHLMRGRLLGGKLHKAQKGELKCALPIGFCYDNEDRIVPDPDEEVRGAVAWVFRLFQETGSAYGVVRRFVMQGLSFPKRAFGGPWDGKLIWARLSHARVLQILKNPVYAGTYVFGRFQYRRQISGDGQVTQQVQRMPISEWRVNLPSHHDGYISWDEFLKNQERLAKNRTNAQATILNGAAREGLALMQGMLICGSCGHALTVSYRGNGGSYPQYLCNWQHRAGFENAHTLSLGADLIDTAVAAEVLKALEPAQLKLAIAAVEELQARDQKMLHQWQMRLERARYEAALAERRYEEADPSNRLVAATLERRWNENLQKLEELQKQYQAVESQQARVATPEQKKQVLALAKDLPRLWHAPSTQAKDRKRMLRLLIKDITVEKREKSKQITLHIRWQGGACSDLNVQLLPSRADQVRCPEHILTRVRELVLNGLRDRQIAEQLNQEGRVSPRGKAFTIDSIRWIRWRYRVLVGQLKRPEELTVKQVAKRLGVSIHVVYYWLARGVLTARRLHANGTLWITLSAEKTRELRERVTSSVKIQRSKHS